MAHSRQARRTRRKARRQAGHRSVATSYTHPDAKIKVFMSADKIKPTLEALCKSLRRYGYSYEILGLGRPWKGFKTKMENFAKGIKDYTASAGPDELAIFIDAYDCICIKDSTQVLHQYLNRKRSMPILFAAEPYCLGNNNIKTLDWFDYHLGAAKRAKVNALVKPYSDEDPDFKMSDKSIFLNSGFIMGPAKMLHELFSYMDESKIDDDQLAACEYFIHHLDKVDLDFEGKIIRTKIPRRDPLPDEGNRGPGFLHYPDMREDDSQAELLKLYSHY
jgi:hypothetical protein